MADEAQDEIEDGDSGDAAPKKTPGKKLVLLIALPVALLVLGGAAAMLLMGGGQAAEVHADAAEHAEAGHDGHDTHDAHGADHGEHAAYDDGHGGDHGGHLSAEHVVFYQLPDILVNIQTDDSRPSYLKLTLTLEVDSEDLVHELELAMPRVMDRFQGFLRELRVDDLNGSAGSYRLRQELLRRVNLAVAPSQVRAVLIEEMLIQ